MKALNIIVEGQTELEFTREVLSPYFRKQGILNIRPTELKLFYRNALGSSNG